MNKEKLNELINNCIYELLLFAVFLIALFLRFYTDTYHLVMVPDYDGYQYVKIAKFMRKGILVDEAVNWTPLLPALIALFSFLPMPLDQIGSYINIFFGAFTIFPIYLFVRNIFNKETAFFSVLIYAFHPHIAFVNVQVMSETTYIFMIFMFSWVASIVIKEQKYTLKYGILSGLFGGLIYLGRPEGTLIFICLSILVVMTKKADIKAKINWLIINFISFVIVIFPYALFLKNKIGKFVFSGKSREILPHIKNMMGVPENLGNYYETFTYDLNKTFNFIKNNLINAWLLITDDSKVYAIILLILFVFFVIALKDSLLGFWKGIIYFATLITPVTAVLIFKVDHRYLSPTTSIFSVICGIGLCQGYIFISKYIRLNSIKISILSIVIILIAFWGFYKVYDQFERKGEINIIFEQERLYKKTGLWLKAHIPSDSKIVSTSTNYLIAYYAGDLAFENVSKPITEKDVLELICLKKNTYLVINDYAVTRYYKDLKYLLNPHSLAFKNSYLYDKIVPVYYDDIAGVSVYTCRD